METPAPGSQLHGTLSARGSSAADYGRSELRLCDIIKHQFFRRPVMLTFNSQADNWHTAATSATNNVRGACFRIISTPYGTDRRTDGRRRRVMRPRPTAADTGPNRGTVFQLI